jgi:hypothetical protein
MRYSRKYVNSFEEKGVEARTRLVWAYFSQYFFLTDDNKNFYALMTKVVIGLLLPFVQPDCKLNFTALAEKRDEILGQIRQRMERIIGKLQILIKESMFRIRHIIFDYPRLEEELYAIFKKNNLDYSKDDLKNEWRYWEAVVRILKNFSVNGRIGMDNILDKESTNLEAFVLEIAGTNHMTLLEYIYSRFAELGVYRQKARVINITSKKDSHIDGIIRRQLWK